MDERKKCCPKCMEEVDCNADICPICGKSVQQRNKSHQLPVGTLLKNRYFIGCCIGEGGFGITYIGRDLTLNMPVAVKEYYPVGMVNRFNSAQITVSLENETSVTKGKKRFLDEAQTLARFASEPNIVCVRDFFETNETAYIVTEYLQGVSLKKTMEESGPMPFSKVFQMLSPVMDVLEKIHQQKLLHRDISPSNLIQLANGTVKLLDFGTARDFDSENKKSKSVIVTPGYAPEEQYSSHGDQGPWTDVYGLCATIYKLITGRTPTNPLQRMSGEPLARPSELGAAITPAQEAALMKGLAIKREERFQSMTELKAAFIRASEPEIPTGDDDERTVTKPDGAVDDLLFNELGAAGTLLSGRQEEQEEAERQKKRGDGKQAEKLSTENRKEKKPFLQREQRRKKKRGFHPGFIALGGFAALFVLAMTVLILRNSPYDEEGAARLSKITVTRSMIHSIGRDPDIRYLNLSDCEVSDEVMREIGQLARIESVGLDGCSGFTTLAPLADMPALTDLDISGDSWAETAWTLDGAAFFPREFPNVEDLHIYKYSFSDQGAFLKQFPSMQTLMIVSCDNSEVDLGALSGASELDYLRLSEVSVVNNDYTALENCSKLKHITLNDMGISDISWMRNLTEIEFLELDHNNLYSLDGLQNHDTLYSLSAGENQINDISGLRGCSGLNNLNVHDNQIGDVSPLAECGELSSLVLSGNQIADVSALSGCTQLNTLSLNDNQVRDISPLQDCTELTYLYLNRLQLTNLDACEAMTDLKVICAKDNRITDISGLVNTTQLQDVRLSGNQIADISYLSKNAGKMQYVLLSDNQISDISALAGNPELAMVTLDNNLLTNLDALSESKGLQYLSAYGNQLTDISGISGCTSLAYIDLGDNQIKDIGPLSTCTYAQQGLFLQNNNISDLSPLPAEVDYRLLSIYGNPISDFSVIQYLSNINSVWDHLYLSWDENADYSYVAATPYNNLHFIDVPIDRQAPIKVQNKEVKKQNGLEFPAEPAFQTFKEAEADIAAIREKSKENQGNITDAINLSHFF